MIDYKRSYPDKRISIDGKVIHFNKGGNRADFFAYIIMELSLLYFLMVYVFPLVKDDAGTVFFIVFTCCLSYLILAPLIELLFVNETVIDYEKKEITTINVFGKKKKYLIKNVNNINFYCRVYWANRGLYYKVVLINENKKIVILNWFSFKREAEKMSEWLNNFKHFDAKE